MKSKDNQKYVILRAANGEDLAVSETLKSNAAVKKNIVALQKVAKTAIVVDMTEIKNA